jgi:hypothetical protein
MRPDPLRVLAHAREARDHRLVALLLRRLRNEPLPARRAVRHLERALRSPPG